MSLLYWSLKMVIDDALIYISAHSEYYEGLFFGVIGTMLIGRILRWGFSDNSVNR
jgi:hypothetical protein